MIRRWLFRRLVRPEELAWILRHLLELLQAHPRTWTYLEGVSFGYGVGYRTELRATPEDVERDRPASGQQRVVEPSWTVAWDDEWRYRIVPLDTPDARTGQPDGR